MVFLNTVLNVTDNSGASKIRCIGILGNKKKAKVGDIIIGVVIKSQKTLVLRVKKSDIVKALIVRTKHKIRRPQNTFFQFDDNAVVLLDTKNNPIGTRVFGAISTEIKQLGFLKLTSLATEVM